MISLDEMNPSGSSKAVRVVGITFGAVLLVFVILFVAFVAFKQPPMIALYGLERWAGFVANLVVLFYTFPAFKRTKRVGFLYAAIAALIFLYASVFGLLFPTTHNTLGQRQWYYVAREISYIVGLGFYARGIMLLSKEV